jgi:hypothetical protein
MGAGLSAFMSLDHFLFGLRFIYSEPSSCFSRRALSIDIRLQGSSEGRTKDKQRAGLIAQIPVPVGYSNPNMAMVKPT